MNRRCSHYSTLFRLLVRTLRTSEAESEISCKTHGVVLDVSSANHCHLY